MKKLAMLFTGQGAQFAGMGRFLAENFSIARETFEEADEALGEPLSRLCWEGPEDQLSLTENTQPATLVVSVAAYRVLEMTPNLAAGHSLGEYSALTAAGALDFADAVRLVRERGKCMQQAVPAGEGGMVVLRKLTRDEAVALVDEVTAGVCEIANFNAPGQYVLSGEKAAMDQVIEMVGERRALVLPVSVPFHCSMLKEAAATFGELLDQVAMSDPAFPILLQRRRRSREHGRRRARRAQASVRRLGSVGSQRAADAAGRGRDHVCRVRSQAGLDSLGDPDRSRRWDRRDRNELGDQPRGGAEAQAGGALGHVNGASPRWLRWSLWPFSWIYGGAVRMRNALFDVGIKRVERVEVPVVSVGNLTSWGHRQDAHGDVVGGNGAGAGS